MVKNVAIFCAIGFALMVGYYFVNPSPVEYTASSAKPKEQKGVLEQGKEFIQDKAKETANKGRELAGCEVPVAKLGWFQWAWSLVTFKNLFKVTFLVLLIGGGFWFWKNKQ